MTDQQLLGLTTFSNPLEIKNALIKKISDLDFEIDIESIFNYIHCSQRLIQKTNITTTQEDIVTTDEYRETINNFDTEEQYITPKELVRHFEVLYDNPATRFNKLLWKTALESVSWYDKKQLELYVKPVIDFLKGRPFLKSDVLYLMTEHLPLIYFFKINPDEDNEAFWQEYELVYNLLGTGNLILDLHAEELNTGQFTTPQLDEFYNRLMMSSHYSRKNMQPQAFNVLSDGIPAEIKPSLMWQRELNILYKAATVEKNDTISELFANTINSALNAFPDDENLLYLRAKYLFHFYTPEEFREDIIITLKKNPNHQKCLFLLGKCYMDLGISRAALIIFENLKKLNPMNMQYVTATALASRKYIDFCISEHDPKENDKYYYITMVTTLIEKEMFEEVAVFAAEAPKEDMDIKALLLLSKNAEDFLITGKKNREELVKALAYAEDKEIIRKIKNYYLKDLPDWAGIKAEKEFIIKYYKEYPNDSNANYQMGMLYYAETDHEKAYDCLLKAKKIDPADIDNYYNLARVTLQVKIYSEAIEYISVYLQYNRYNVVANEVYCDCAYEMKDYLNAHNTAKWLLSICREREVTPKHFFYFTAGLSFYLDKFESQHYNIAYLNDMLELYDQYPKPETFWTNDNGSKSMYWAAIICQKMGHFEKGVTYIETILQNVKEYDWELMENCLFKLLPECLYDSQNFEKLIQTLETPALELLQKQTDNPLAAVSCLFLSLSYSELGSHEAKMQWALDCAKCYMNRNNPPIDWVDEFLLKNIVACIELNLHEHAILLGKAYLGFIKNIKDNHIWLTHNLANSYQALDQKEEALHYHRICIEFGNDLSLECVEVNDSQEFINTLN